nr:MAG TPA_asm: hypothetical protein [Caudoviricetes sp.]
MIWLCAVFFVILKPSFCCTDFSSDRGALQAG